MFVAQCLFRLFTLKLVRIHQTCDGVQLHYSISEKQGLGVKRSLRKLFMSSNLTLDPLIAEQFVHNEDLLVNQLPDEVLSLIFFYTIVWSLDDDTIHIMLAKRTSRSGKVAVRENKAVMHASHVCRHWRTVAMNEATLWNHWSFFDVKNPDWFVELERRSRDAAVVVRTVQEISSSADYILPRHTNRIKALEYVLCEPNGYGPASWTQLLTYAFPLLESLTLIYHSSYQPFDHNAFPRPLFGGTASNLRRVHLIGVGFDLYDVNFKQITHLTLERIGDVSPEQWSGLHNLACLEVLDIGACGYLDPTDDEANFPRLRRFTLSGQVERARSWYKGVSYPSDCAVSISVAAHKNLQEQQLPSIRELAEILSSRTRENYTSKQLSFPWEVSVGLTSFTITNGPPDTSTFSFTLKMFGTSFNFTSFVYFRDYVSIFATGVKPLLKSMALSLHHPGIFHLQLFQAFAQAERLITFGQSSFTVTIPYLAQLSGQEPNQDPTLPVRPRFFPALQLWEISGLEMLSSQHRDLIEEMVKQRFSGRNDVHELVQSLGHPTLLKFTGTEK
ncbi:hypothetical protein CPB83DRAFT_856407, partial [Crepidotus variabilis]